MALAEAFRVLEPGGHLALDTPNAAVCRLEQDAFIDPDHKVEYSLDVLTAKVVAAGFEVVTARGLNWGGTGVARGVFDRSEVAAHNGIYLRRRLVLPAGPPVPKARGLKVKAGEGAGGETRTPIPEGTGT